MNKESPLVSVIMPAKNEEAHIARTIKSIKNMDYDQSKIEMILVDNGSIDNTLNIAKEMGITTYQIDNVNVGSVRNYGASNAQGVILAFLDADCEVKKNWLKSAVELLKKEQTGAVGGQCESPKSGNWLEKTWAPYEAKYDGETMNLAASSLIITKELFGEIGGFNEELTAGEDDEISSRIRGIGKKLYFSKECAVVHWGYPRSILDVIRRQIWHGSNQISAAESIFDKMLLMTHIFIISTILVIPGFLKDIKVGFIFLTGMLVAPTIITLVKQKKENSKIDILILSKRIIVYFFYFVGRSIGLLVNYFYLVGNKEKT